MVVDADELWDEMYLKMAIEVAKSEPYRTHRVFMRHFWRSCRWVCDDGAAPTRFIKPNVSGEEPGYISDQLGKVFHMGYAQTPAIIHYKMSIHGHKNDIRPGWYDNTFLPWKPGMGDVHPTNVNYWTPVPYNDNGELERIAINNPHYHVGIIE